MMLLTQIRHIVLMILNSEFITPDILMKMVHLCMFTRLIQQLTLLMGLPSVLPRLLNVKLKIHTLVQHNPGQRALLYS